MNMFNLVSRFWKAAEEEKFTPSEAALFFYLLNKANTQMWQMPIRCPTSTICAFISTTKQNVIKAREGLKQRGLITFIPGSGTNESPLYSLIESSDQLSGQLSPQLSSELSGQLSLYKNKDTDQDFSSKNARVEDVLSLDELEKMFLEDDAWQQSVFNLLLAGNQIGATIDFLRDYISQFFLYLKTSGQKERETNDCKRYFVNWLKKQLTSKNRDGNHRTNSQDRRRANEVSATSTEAYHQSF